MSEAHSQSVPDDAAAPSPREWPRPGSEPDISARLDRLPGAPMLWRFVALLSFGAFFEIYDIGLTAPLSLGLARARIFQTGAGGFLGMADQATFVAATFAGLWLGTLAFSSFADRLGRRPVFTWALVWYSVATIVMGLQSTALSLDFWRFVASLGVGMELVAIDCYLAELAPKAIRGRAFTLSTAIQFLSAPVGAVLALLLIPHAFHGVQGWRWLCFFPGLGALGVWWVRRGIPESPRWLAAHGRETDADRIVGRIEARVAAETPLPLPSPSAMAERAPMVRPTRFADLWSAPLRGRTLTMIVFHLFQTIGYFGFSAWLPTLLVAKGVTVTKTLSYGAAIAVAMPLAPLLFSLFADQLERKWQIAAGAIMVAGFGLGYASLTVMSAPLAFIGLGLAITVGNSLMSYAFHTYQSEIFPTDVRARAVGFVYSFSRLSALLSGYIIGFTLLKAGPTGVFVLISAAMLIVSATIALFGPATRGRSIEEISPGTAASVP
ncbi:MAG TPA: MFS transporter [Caulobacteraceae bacterium]|nr:MFS transporter [Caulobacteraceae bacterium]